MEDVKDRKQKLRKEMVQKLSAMPEEVIRAKTDRIISELFQFANFMESESALFYFRPDGLFDALQILRHGRQLSKNIVLPSFDSSRVKFWRVENLEADLIAGEMVYVPDTERCKPISSDTIDVAIAPGAAFDEKGGRLGSGLGLFDRLIPKLPATTRKIALALEEQVISHVPMESNDKFVDIIITDKRIIYKI